MSFGCFLMQKSVFFKSFPPPRFLQNVSIFFLPPLFRFDLLLRFTTTTTNTNNNMGRRKNPHPKRAVNARTVLKVVKGRTEEEGEEGEEEPLVLCSRIPEEDDFEANHHQIQKEDEEEGEEEGEDDDVKRLRRILTCVPCDDDVVMEQNQMREAETAYIAKGVKRKRGGHECDVCEKVFQYPSKLARHMRTHTKDKPYECDVCEKRFSRSDYLKVHMRIHTNEKPYECHLCEKRYRTSGALKVHMRTQH